MAIQDCSNGVIIVDLPSTFKTADEIKSVSEVVLYRGDCDVILDFSDVSLITSSGLAALLKLRKLLDNCGHRLILCNVAAITKGVFKITGSDKIFEFIDDKSTALAKLHHVY